MAIARGDVVHAFYDFLSKVPAGTTAGLRTQIECDEFKWGIAVAPDKPQLKLHLMANGAPWTYEGWKTAWQKELEKEVDGKNPGSLQRTALGVHGLRKNAVCMLLEVGCTEEQVSAIVGMSPQMVRHYAKEVSKFRLARSAIKLLEAGWAEQRVHVLGARKTD